MQISKQHIDPDFEKSLKNVLAGVMADLPDKDSAFRFLGDFLTETEFVVLSKRLMIIKYLDEGKSYNDIKNDIKVSSATIATVQSQIQKKGSHINIAIKYIKAQEWANNLGKNFLSIFGMGK